MPARFAGRSDGLDARFRLKVDDIVRDVVIRDGACDVAPPNGVRPDVEIHTDAQTWLDMDAGRLSGIDAFASKKVSIRGSIDKSLQFEPNFERPDAGAVRYEILDLKAKNATISALVAGDPAAAPVVLIHGLGASKASWLTIVGGLARTNRVIAIDLPGFGASSKPIGRYDAPWFAGYVAAVLDELEHERAHLVGNSMGGRVAMECAMRMPERVDSVACLCPAAAFTHRPGLLLARLMRPEWGILAGILPRNRMREGLRHLFADANCVEEEWYEAAIDDFLDVWKSPRARLAFSRSLRNIYLDEPEGDSGFWTRLSFMQPPSLFIYGDRDVLITHTFGRKIRNTVPGARVEVWKRCGHVPQIEYPGRTVRALTRFFDRARSTAA